jgi:hypothetical protein
MKLKHDLYSWIHFIVTFIYVRNFGRNTRLNFSCHSLTKTTVFPTIYTIFTSSARCCVAILTQKYGVLKAPATSIDFKVCFAVCVRARVYHFRLRSGVIYLHFDRFMLSLRTKSGNFPLWITFVRRFLFRHPYIRSIVFFFFLIFPYAF